MTGNTIALFLPDFRGGGAERVCVNLANAFVAKGLNVDVVVMRQQGEFLPLLDPRIKVVDLGTPRPRHVLAPLVRYLQTARPDALLANMWPLTILSALARMVSQVDCRLVVVEHTTWSFSELAKRWHTRMIIKSTMRCLLRRADAVVAVSKGAAADLEQFAGFPPGCVKAIYNPVTHRREGETVLQPESCTDWAAGPHKRVLAVGTMKAVKDFPVLLQAFSFVCSGVHARLLILGEGEERARLQHMIDSLGLQNRVDMPGFVADTTAYYAHADLFVLSSSYEGFGNVIVEALEHGVPVVSTDCPNGPREILADGEYGRLVQVGDAQGLGAAMLEALQSNHDTVALKARAGEFAVVEAAERYLDLLVPGWQKTTARAGGSQ